MYDTRGFPLATTQTCIYVHMHTRAHMHTEIHLNTCILACERIIFIFNVNPVQIMYWWQSKSPHLLQCKCKSNDCDMLLFELLHIDPMDTEDNSTLNKLKPVLRSEDLWFLHNPEPLFLSRSLDSFSSALGLLTGHSSSGLRNIYLCKVSLSDKFQVLSQWKTQYIVEPHLIQPFLIMSLSHQPQFQTIVLLNHYFLDPPGAALSAITVPFNVSQGALCH